MPKVSVIVPIHNAEFYLERCLKSLMQQTERDMEFILVDDASTDRSLDVMECFRRKDARFLLYSFSENQGVSIARNKGIDLSNGDYIGFVDSDDFVNEKFYEQLKELIDESGISIATGSVMHSCFESENVEGIYDFSQVDLVTGGVSACNRLFKRELIGEDYFLPHTRLEDTAFTILMHMKSGKMIGTSETYYYYCNDNENSFNQTDYWTPKTILDAFCVADYLGSVSKEREYCYPYQEQIKTIQLSLLLDNIEIIDALPWTEEESSSLYGQLAVLLDKRYGDWRKVPYSPLSRSVLGYHLINGGGNAFMKMSGEECFQDFTSKVKTLEKRMKTCAK